jgi:alcohol dehydrogenase class IV
MEFNCTAAPGRYADIAVALGCNREGDDVSTANKGIEKVRSIISECGIPSRLSEVGIPKQAIPQLATDALKIQRLLKNNPRDISESDAIDIYMTAY